MTDEFKSVEKQVLEAWSAHGVNAEELYRSSDKTPLSYQAIEAYILLSAHLLRITVSGSLQKGAPGYFLVGTPLIFPYIHLQCKMTCFCTSLSSSTPSSPCR